VITLVLNFAAIAITVRLRPSIAPTTKRMTWTERRLIIAKALPALLLLTIVFGGLYSGIFTINEAASVGVVVALAFAVLRRRLNWSTLIAGLIECAGVSVMLYVIVFGA